MWKHYTHSKNKKTHSVFLVVTLQSNPAEARQVTDLQEREIDNLYSIRSLHSFFCQSWIVPHSKFWSASFSLNLKLIILILLPPFPKVKCNVFLLTSTKCGYSSFRSKHLPSLATAYGNLCLSFFYCWKHLKRFWRNRDRKNPKCCQLHMGSFWPSILGCSIAFSG